jgi:hypothetical protein
VFGSSILASHGFGMFNGFYMVLKDVPVKDIFDHVPTMTCGRLIESIAPLAIALFAMFFNEDKHLSKKTVREIDERIVSVEMEIDE